MSKPSEPHRGRMRQADLTQAVYDYVHTLGNVGEEVKTAIHPFLRREFGLTYAEAQSARRSAMAELTKRGCLQRLNTRGAYVRILG